MPKTNKKTIRENVEAILRDCPETRNDDKVLTAMYWLLHDGLDTTNGDSFIKTFANATPSESLTRARRLIQEEGKYLPDDATVANRRGRQVAMRNAVRNREVV